MDPNILAKLSATESLCRFIGISGQNKEEKLRSFPLQVPMMVYVNCMLHCGAIVSTRASEQEWNPWSHGTPGHRPQRCMCGCVGELSSDSEEKYPKIFYPN